MQGQHEPGLGRGQGAWRWHWALPLCPIAASMFCLSALVYYHTVLQGTGEAWGFFQGAVVGMYRWMGFVPTFMFWLLMFAWCSVWFVTGRFERPWARIGWMTTFALSLALVVNLGTDGVAPPPHAGIVGTFLAVRLVSVFGVVFSALLALGAALATLFLATDFLFYRHFEALARGRGAPAVESGVEPEATDAFRELAFAGIYGEQARVSAEGAPAPRKRIVLEDESVAGFAAAQAVDPAPPLAPVGTDDGAVIDTRDAGIVECDPVIAETEEFEVAWDEATGTAIEPDRDAEEEADEESDGDPAPNEPIVELTPAAPRAAPNDAEAVEAPTYELPRPAPASVPEDVDLAAREVLAAGRASVTLLRRRLGCSAGEAQDLLDALRDFGVVDGARGAPQGGVATTLAQWDAR